MVFFADGFLIQSLTPGTSHSVPTHLCMLNLMTADGPFQSVLRLKSNWNRILAVDAHTNVEPGQLVVQTLDSGVLSCQLDVEKVQHANSEYVATSIPY